MHLSLLALLLVLLPAHAHMWLRTPISRGGTNFAGGTSGPCSGRAAGSGVRTTYEVGSKVTFQFRVNQHGPAPFKFALSSTSTDSFTTVIKDNIPNTVTAGADGFDGVNVEVTIPDTPCNECSIQLSGMGQVGGSGMWYNCADVKIIPAGSGGLPSTSSVQPVSGNVGGGVTVTITGANFGSSASNKLRCRFGINTVAATWVSPTQVTCVAPPYNQALKVPVDVSTDGGEVFSSTGSLFQYTGSLIRPQVLTVEPSEGERGTQVTITGRYFYAPAMMCRFGTASSEATVVSDTEATCTVPETASAESNKADVAFEVSIDGSPYSQSGVEFTLRNAKSDAPGAGPSAGQRATVALGALLALAAAAFAL